MDLILLTSSVGLLALLVVSYLAWSILKEPVGTPEMKAVADAIELGAKAFLKRQYTNHRHRRQHSSPSP